MKLTTGRACGGYTSVSWQSVPNKGSYRADRHAFVFSLDYQRVFRAQNISKAVYHADDYGPNFGGSALSLFHMRMNETDVGLSVPKMQDYRSYYNIAVDSKGNNVLTGESWQEDPYDNTFTIKELLVYRVIL